MGVSKVVGGNVPAASAGENTSGRRPSAGILMLDPVGEVFGRVRELGLPAEIWRILDARRISTKLDLSLAIYAAYGQVDWDAVMKLDDSGPTVLITTTYDREEAIEALRRDLVGYLDAALPRDALDRALRALLLRRQHAFPRDVVGSWVWEQRSGRRPKATADGLTPRQRQIVALIARGGTDKEIAAELGIATATAQKHVTNILQRLHVPNRAAAAATFAGYRS